MRGSRVCRRCVSIQTGEQVTLTALIQLKSITKVYRAGDEPFYALAGIDLEVRKNEFVAVMGASGSGKSTLMNIIGALDRPTDGEYRLDGVEVQSLKDRKLSALRNRKIGFVFQAFNLLPRYNAVQNVEVPLIYGGVPARTRRKLAVEALEKLGLGHRLKHKPTELSGGQQQRVAIARAIVTRPVLLLADEPTGAVDSETTQQILALLEQLHREGMTIVLVTHEAEVAERAQRIVRLSDGRIIDDTGVRTQGRTSPEGGERHEERHEGGGEKDT